MSNGASKSSNKNNKGSKPSGFAKKGSQLGTANVTTVPPGKPGIQLKNIQDAANASRGYKPKMPDIITADPKNPGKAMLDNLKKLASTPVTSGDNPFKK